MATLITLFIILLAATICGILAHFLHLPHIVGFLLAGIFIGPAGLGLIQDPSQIHLWSEVGIVLLLFTIGLELSPKHIQAMGKMSLKGGSLQIGATIITTSLILLCFDLSFSKALFWGLILSLSSTAVVLTLLQERNELESPQGRLSLAILIFQDILVIPFLLLIPVLSGINILQNINLSNLAKSISILILLSGFALFILPRLVNFLASTRKRELFLLGILIICFGISGVTYLAGLSLSIGAFLAGILLSRTDYHLQIISEIEPFKDLLLCIFFVSIGLMFNPISLNIYFLGKAFILAAGSIFLKVLIIFLVIQYLGYTWNISLATAILLFQIGEFSFILAQEGLKYNLISTLDHQLLIIITIISIILTPLAYYFLSSKILLSDSSNLLDNTSTCKNHLIIVGFGPIGRNLANEASINNIPHIIIEMNPITVRKEKKKKIPIIFGDASKAHVLQKVGINKAKAIAITTPDVGSSRKITNIARHLNPKLHITVRTRYIAEKKILEHLGANEVVVEEIIAAKKIFDSIIRHFKN